MTSARGVQAGPKVYGGVSDEEKVKEEKEANEPLLEAVLSALLLGSASFRLPKIEEAGMKVIGSLDMPSQPREKCRRNFEFPPRTAAAASWRRSDV